MRRSLTITAAIAILTLAATRASAQINFPKTGYYVAISGITDLVGQGVGGGTYATWTTGVGPQPSAATVVAVTPLNGAAGVPVNVSVQVQLSAPGSRSPSRVDSQGRSAR